LHFWKRVAKIVKEKLVSCECAGAWLFLGQYEQAVMMAAHEAIMLGFYVAPENETPHAQRAEKNIRSGTIMILC
jgi:hypothetical protein